MADAVVAYNPISIGRNREIRHMIVFATELAHREPDLPVPFIMRLIDFRVSYAAQSRRQLSPIGDWKRNLSPFAMNVWRMYMNVMVRVKCIRMIHDDE